MFRTPVSYKEIPDENDPRNRDTAVIVGSDEDGPYIALDQRVPRLWGLWRVLWDGCVCPTMTLTKNDILLIRNALEDVS